MEIDGAVSQTAVEAWDKRWATNEGRADWLVPHPAAVAIQLHARGARRVLDLGCGVGRHALLLAEHGFDVEPIDGSLAGLTVVRETAAARALPVSLHQGLVDALPFPDDCFDYVLSWNVTITLPHPGKRLFGAARRQSSMEEPQTNASPISRCRSNTSGGSADPTVAPKSGGSGKLPSATAFWISRCSVPRQ
jgi:SAM-dependent methyltransferase